MTVKMQLKKLLYERSVTIGSWVTLGHPAIAEILARAGYDWIVVNLEHSVIAIDTAGDLIRIIDLCGVAPLVRLTSNDPDQIKRVMDAGAHGIVVPMVNTPQTKPHVPLLPFVMPQRVRGVSVLLARKAMALASKTISNGKGTTRL